MTSEFPAGLDRMTLEEVLRLDSDVLSFERLNDQGSMWRAAVSVEGGEPVNVFIDNGINELYVQALIPVDYDEITVEERQLVIASAMTALEPYAPVGLAAMGGRLYLRSAFFIDFCNIHAFTNTLKCIVLAYVAHNRQIPITAAALQV
ncbi:hypothetical protein ACQ86B_29170 (plasmid) [Mycolicibacterium aichiense]|uniref:hypothetical protein n=1 Tax=Mycolicibacterium aichiense TaxID=1799 RepID=UPI003D669C46